MSIKIHYCDFPQKTSDISDYGKVLTKKEVAEEFRSAGLSEVKSFLKMLNKEKDLSTLRIRG